MLKSFTHYLQGFLIMAGTSKGLSRVEPMNGEVLAIGLSLDKFVPSGFDSFRIGFGVICRRNEVKAVSSTISSALATVLVNNRRRAQTHGAACRLRPPTGSARFWLKDMLT
jgi:hypothetical protein